MSESPLIATIVHDLAGHLTSVGGLLEIVAARPDHSSRDELLATATSESRTAVQALKDLQMMRSLDSGDLRERVEAVSLEGLFERVRKDLPEEQASVLTLPESGAPAIVCDADLLGDLLKRIVLLALETNRHAVRDLRVEATEKDVWIGIDLGPRTEWNDVEEGRKSGRKVLRPVALADILLTRWGGSVQTEVGERSRLSLFLRRA